MEFNYIKSAKFPQLAWCAIVSKGNNMVDIKCGNSVETNDNFFVAGVWSGDFRTGNFAESNFICCSGASVNKCKWGGVKFTTPSHMLDAVYAIRVDEKLYISNSIPFALAQSNLDLQPNYFDYERDLCSSLFGFENQITTSPLAEGRTLEIFRACSFEITEDLKIVKTNHQSNLSFKNYDEYAKAIRDVLSKIKANAQSSLRKHPYEMVTTISRGYDATAVSALAHEIGCDKALTFCKPASYADDNGAEIAKTIGYTEILETDANLYKSNTELIEAKCAANDANASSIVFAAYHKLFSNCLLFMGSRGDSIWGKGHANVNDSLDFTNGNGFSQASHSFNEICFESNIIDIPVPLIAADHWSEIDAISSSKEMSEYSTGNDYDRPIPRRIVEEYGVARTAFGQKKQGAGISYHFDTLNRIMNKMSPNSANDLQSYRKTFKPSKWKQFRHNIKFYAAEYPTYVNYVFSKTPIKLRLNKTEKYISSPHSTLLFNWSISRLIPRYKD
jgi:hypothetical protein